MRPTSHGYVKLKSLNPYDHPIINPNYLATEQDRVELRDAVCLTREIFNQVALDPFRGRELQPGIIFPLEAFHFAIEHFHILLPLLSVKTTSRAKSLT